jgi:hypothetical protein
VTPTAKRPRTQGKRSAPRPSVVEIRGDQSSRRPNQRFPCRTLVRPLRCDRPHRFIDGYSTSAQRPSIFLRAEKPNAGHSTSAERPTDDRDITKPRVTAVVGAHCHGDQAERSRITTPHGVAGNACSLLLCHPFHFLIVVSFGPAAPFWNASPNRVRIVDVN